MTTHPAPLKEFVEAMRKGMYINALTRLRSHFEPVAKDHIVSVRDMINGAMSLAAKNLVAGQLEDHYGISFGHENPLRARVISYEEDVRLGCPLKCGWQSNDIDGVDVIHLIRIMNDHFKEAHGG